MWQADIIGVARFIEACLERVYTSAGPPRGGQASDQPQVGWEICNDSSDDSSAWAWMGAIPALYPNMSELACECMHSDQEHLSGAHPLQLQHMSR